MTTKHKRQEEMKEVAGKIKSILEESGFGIEPFINYGRRGLMADVRLVDTREQEITEDKPSTDANQTTDSTTSGGAEDTNTPVPTE
jgi:hypothetical protein